MLNQKKIFFPNLDGLRFFCFLLVFLHHSFHTNLDSIKNSSTYVFIKYDLFINGNIGVNFFFVLSGFLITYLLIEEKNIQGKIDIPKFWLRRILKIWPLYFLCVALGFLIIPVIKNYFGEVSNETANPIYYLTFISNFDFINSGMPDSALLGILWSIAIEEQFYFIWPILLTVIPSKHYTKLFLVVLIASWIFQAYAKTPLAFEYHTLSCMGDLTIGGLGAYLCRVNNIKAWLENLKRSYIYIIYIVFFTLFIFREHLFLANYYTKIFERSFLACIILIIILEQNFSKNSFFKFSQFKLISKLGEISYGLYCLHFIGILITLKLFNFINIQESVWTVLLFQTIISLLITIILSKLCFNFWESPFLKLKAKFSFITR